MNTCWCLYKGVWLYPCPSHPTNHRKEKTPSAVLVQGTDLQQFWFM